MVMPTHSWSAESGESRTGRAFACWLLLGLILLAGSNAGAEERRYYFDSAGSEQGLAQHTVNAFLQDRSGYVWIATQGGLHKYDGYRFTIYQHDGNDASSLPDSFVTAIAQDDRDQIWVGGNTRNLARLDPATGKAQAFSLPPDIANLQRRNAIQALLFDPARGLWVGTASGIELLKTADGSRRELFRFDPSPAQPAHVLRLALDAQGTLWCLTTSGLLRFASQSDTAQHIDLSEISGATSLTLARDGSIYLGTSNGLMRLRSQTEVERVWPKVGGAAAATAGLVRDMVEDARGRLWLAIYGEGLLVLDPATGAGEWLRHERDLPGSPPEEFETHLFIDRSELLWVGGETRGFATTDPAGTMFRYLVDRNAERSSGNNNFIRAIWEDRQRQLWLGTEGGGLKRYDPSLGSFERFDDVIEHAAGNQNPASALRVFALQGGESGKVWVATNRGVFALNPEKRQAVAVGTDAAHPGTIAPLIARTLLVASDGTIWFATVNSGLAHWWPQSGRWEYLRHDQAQPDSLAHDFTLALCEDRDGRLWIGTLDGLSMYDPRQRTMRSFRHDAKNPRSLSDDLVRAIYQGADGSLWFGTYGGLNRLDLGGDGSIGFKSYRAGDGLPNMVVYGVLEDTGGKLWLSTNRGISRFDREQETFHSFSLKDGLQGLEFNGGAALARSNGELVFGGTNGLNLFRPETVKLSHYVPPVVITGTQVGRADFQSKVASSSLEMAQAERIVRFEFAALDYAAPERNQFTYRLEGFDDNWVQAGTRHDATYTNLAPGDYRFRVRASNRDGVWNDQGATLALTITPAWWAGTPMKILYVAAFALIGLALWRSRQQRREEERRHHRELQQREDRLRMALWGSGDDFWDYDFREDTLHTVSAGQLNSRDGVGEVSVSAKQWREQALHPDDVQNLLQRLGEHVDGRRDFYESEYRQKNADGRWAWMLTRGKIVERDAAGNPVRACGTSRDISVIRAAERERRIAAEVLNSMTEAVCVTDLDFHFISVNHSFTRMSGYSEADVLGQSASLLNCAQHPPQFYSAMRDEFVSSGHWRGELWQKRKDGEEFLCWLEVSAVNDAAGMRMHYVAVMTDITDRKRAEQELRYLANYDTMTGLPNRTLLAERLGQAVIRARRTSRKVAVLFLDLDRFKHVNDSMGHAAGDRMLKAAGARLRSNVRDTDTVARIGGDEFTVVLGDLNDAAEAEKVAQKLMIVFAEPLELDTGQEVVITPSIGISLYPDHGQMPTDLLKFADTAMYQAKERGRNTYMIYTQAMDQSARERANTVAALRKALERRELSLVYQPKMSLMDNRITGVEALLRWHSEELGDITPDRFIPLAEETGIIIEIGEFVLDTACAQLRRWREQGMDDLAMAVNVSVLQLLRGELPARLKPILERHGMQADRLELELTESMLMANAEQSVRTLNELKELGVTLAIDDFGTGYSSLSYLKRLPIDTLKIDQTFVGDITTDPDDEAITATIITMAHSLDLNVVAEGVETREQLEYLREQRCDEIQGHWLSRPMDGEACLIFIRNFVYDRPAQVGALRAAPR